MSKVLASWSGMRKYLGKEMLAPSLKGRITYNCTSYVGMDGCHIFEIYIDRKPAKKFSWETVNTYFIENGLTKNKTPFGVLEYWNEFWSLLDAIPIEKRSEYTDEEFCNALKQYRNNPIEHSINSDNPLIRMFAVLDRRTGKRTLCKLKDTLNLQPEWLKEFIFLGSVRKIFLEQKIGFIEQAEHKERFERIII